MKALFLAVFLTILLAARAPAGDASAPLADAVENQERDRIEALLSGGANLNAAQVDGMTALHWAIWRDDRETARRLVQAGADVNVANRYGIRPLSLACVNGDTELVELLLKTGAEANTPLAGGETALMIAARTGKLGAVRALLAHKAAVNAKEHKGQTAIMWAAAEGHADVVRALIEAGADFRTPLRSGFTPLMFAVREGRRKAVQVLLEAGADVNEAMQPERIGGRAPRKGTSPLLMAVENGHFDLAAALLDSGADPNDQRSGFTALHVITWVRKPNRGDGLDGQPPPIGSGNMTSLQFVRELVAHRADVNARLKQGSSGRGHLSQTGATPFLMACDTADVPLMRLLVELGADPTIPNVDHTPPLVAASGFGTLAPSEEAGTEEEMVEAVTYLLDLGADIDAVDDHGETAMHGAAYNNAPKVVELLASRGATIEVWNQKNKYGWTPLAIAEGERPGTNFKPSPSTIAAIRRAMLAAGVTPPARRTPVKINSDDYKKAAPKKPAPTP
ncbi:MAG: ankyrin repeat domain-containing protein [Planctomycetia bacterium]|nr:ankyrin repeat domain-containing protein [Planctomycetia bacterium]